MNKIIEKVYKSSSCDETKEIAKNLAIQLSAGEIVLLSGDLGSGKTVFAKGFAEGLGINQDITSPTFTIMNCYDNILNHFDLYRLNSIDELLAVGAEEELYGDKISLVEWPEIVGLSFFPKNSILVTITKISEDERLIEISYNN
jgi:tRNA threonylcarbamoyladenosine biosynthesis protein TsaE